MRQFLLLGLAFTIFVSAVSAGTTYGLIQALGGGPRGEQGATGPQGEQGLNGLRGADGASAASDTSGNSLSIALIANALAVTLVSDHNPGRTVKGLSLIHI